MENAKFVNDQRVLGDIKKLPVSEIKSSIIDIFSTAINALNPGLLIKKDEEDRFTLPSKLRQRDITYLDNQLYQVIPDDVIDIELSTVNALGLNTLLGNIDSKTILNTSRGNEVVGDATTVLALEAAKLRRKGTGIKKDIHLCTNHRLTRGQFFSQEGYTPHFKAFNYCIGGVAEDDMGFEIRALKEGIEMYLKIFEHFSRIGFEVPNINVTISNLSFINVLLKEKGFDLAMFTEQMRTNKGILHEIGIAINPRITGEELEKFELLLRNMGINTSLKGFKTLYNNVVIPLKKIYPNVNFSFDIDRIKGAGYYKGFCLHISATNKLGDDIILVDGGFTDWTSKLLSNNKEKFFASGIGTEYFYTYYR